MSDFIPEDFIQKVLEDSDIVSLVDSYVPLKRKGKDHWAQCPFCDDGSNPSFSVSDQKQFYYCFKCRASGNAIGFLMNYQSKDFVGAVEILAKNLGLEFQGPNQIMTRKNLMNYFVSMRKLKTSIRIIF